MTIETEQPPPLKGPWSRRWVRRITYVLASGAVLAGAMAWVLQRPYVDRWLMGQLDIIIRKETGLGFQAERLEVHPFQGRLVLHHPALGGDLFQARLIEVDLDFSSLLNTPHIRRILIQSPRLNVDAQRLAAIHLREHPPSKTTPTFRLDRLDVLDGQAFVNEPAWALDHGAFTFTVDGRGRLANQVWLEVLVPKMALGDPRDRVQGAMYLKFRATDKGIDTANIQAHLGDSALKVLGSYEFPTKVVKADVSGALNLDEVLRLVPQAPGLKRPASTPASGFLDFKGKVQGSATAPTWNLTADGRGIHVQGAPIHPGALHASASGGPGRLRLEKAEWSSPDGKIQAEGAWTRQTGTNLEVKAEDVSLAPAAAYARMNSFKGVTARFHGTASLPGAPWTAPDLGKLKFTGSGVFLKDGQRVGALELSAADSHVRATELDLELPEAGFRGSASAVLTKKGVGAVEAEGEVHTDARAVADSMRAWDLTDLDMSGPARVRATFTWDPRNGAQADGHIQVDTPRWHGAHADGLSGDVSLRKDFLRVTGLELTKGAGHGSGDVWISWAKGPPGAEGIDMCFSMSQLPIEEGLKAGDQGDLPITGIAGGWVRLHGPLNAIVMEGQTVAENGKVYGLTVPAASATFAMDINALRIRATDVRIADNLDHLEGAPGPLNLHGAMDMDAKSERWVAELKGEFDSSIIGLKGPLLQGQVEGKLEGPFTAPLGPSQAPEGVFTLSQGRLSMEGQALEGIDARASFKDGRLQGQAGMNGKDVPVLTFEALQSRSGKLSGDMKVHLAPDAADTSAVASRLSQGFLKDVALDFEGHGDWDKNGIHWKGNLQTLVGSFEGFQLVQTHPSTFRGDTKGMDLLMDLEGRTVTGDGSASSHSTTMRLGGWVPFDEGGALDVKLEGSAELSNLKAIVDHLVDPGQFSLMADLKPAGTAAFKLNLGGKPVEPTLEGSLQLNGGRLTARTYPQSIENVDFTAYFHGRDITIPQDTPLRGHLAQGSLAAWGRLTWGFHGLTDYDMNATLDDFQSRDLPEGFEIQGSFSGSLRGNDKDGGLLRGTVKAKTMLYQADFNITDLILATTVGGGALSTLDPSDPLSRIELDLDLQLARPWELDTNLLKLQGRPTGAFKLGGNLAHPGLKGRMEFLPGGRLTDILPAGDLVLERGSVEFTDPAVFNPIIDLTGRVEVDPYLVTLSISGTFDHLVGTPSSTPALRPDEIFAILVDRSAVNKVGGSLGAPSQSAVSTGIFSQGAGLVSSLIMANGLERLRKTLGLDRVNFAILGGPNLSLTLEKSLDISGHRLPVLYTYQQEGTQTTNSGYVELRFGNFVLHVGARQVTGAAQTPGDTTVQGVQPSGELRYTWTPK